MVKKCVSHFSCETGELGINDIVNSNVSNDCNAVPVSNPNQILEEEIEGNDQSNSSDSFKTPCVSQHYMGN